METRGEIIIYNSRDKAVQLEAKIERENIWLTQAQIAKLFRTDRSVITKHIGNIFKSKELEEKSNVQKMHIASSDKPVTFYNLDMIISVGYRVNSTRATQFRIWATSVLRDHLVDGYTINEKRLKEQVHKLEALQKTIAIISDITTKKEPDHTEALGLLAVISDYNYALGLLDDYDRKRVVISDTSESEKFRLTYEAAAGAVAQLKDKFGYSELFGKEKDSSFKSSIATIYQTFDGRDLYPSIEEKAANLLYFIIKNHSFIDGNKRIGAAIFLWLLDNNGLLYRKDGTKRLADNALVALTLMIAESRPGERDIIIALVVSLVNKRN